MNSKYLLNILDDNNILSNGISDIIILYQYNFELSQLIVNPNHNPHLPTQLTLKSFLYTKKVILFFKLIFYFILGNV